MNTGIGDACDLGWKLAALVKGFGGPGLIPSYEIERRPVGLRNRDASRRHNLVRLEIGKLYDAAIFAEGPQGNFASPMGRVMKSGRSGTTKTRVGESSLVIATGTHRL